MSKNRKESKTGKKGKGSVGLNKKEGQLFLEKNRQKESVVECSSGLQYEIIEQSSGSEKAEINDTVIVHQRLSLIDGTPIVDTYQKNEPAEFLLKEALQGYQEGLLLMNVGDRYKLYLPPELGWGKRGAGKKIGPEAVIVVDVKLLEIMY